MLEGGEWMAGRLVNALGVAAKTAEAFSDQATLRHMLRFEAAPTKKRGRILGRQPQP